MICELCKIEIRDHHNHYADDSGDYHEECLEKYQYEQAYYAGIPKSVLDGKTKLRDHFSKEYIDWKCNRDRNR